MLFFVFYVTNVISRNPCSWLSEASYLCPSLRFHHLSSSFSAFVSVGEGSHAGTHLEEVGEGALVTEIQGVGYRAAKQGSKLTLTLGFSHPVEFEDTDTIKIELKDALHFSITGIDKQEVGQFAAEVRGVRPPEPYKGKGIRYVGEYVIRKEGKAGKGK